MHETANVPPLPDVYELDDVDLVRLTANPLRQRILTGLRAGGATVKELAAELEVPVTRLYYHVNLLEEAGLIEVIETREVSGIIERRYRARARHFVIASSLLEVSDDRAAVGETFRAIFEQVAADVERRIRDDVLLCEEELDSAKRSVLARTGLRLTPERQRAFAEELHALLDRYSDDDGEPYLVAVAAFPQDVRVGDDGD